MTDRIGVLLCNYETSAKIRVLCAGFVLDFTELFLENVSKQVSVRFRVKDRINVKVRTRFNKMGFWLG